ncbi:MAG: carbon-nitrogen hydrolase family protein [Firmicutes bacterium]|nr:carbon-nitrogen hydrolase family protein [Bacillota bacterium]
MEQSTYLAAAVQMAPVWMDRGRSTDKVIAKIRQLGERGVRLAVFPEVIIPGTPHWNWLTPSDSELYALQWENAVELEGPELRAVGEACKEAGMHVVVGITERMRRALFNTIVFFDDQGRRIGVHRKVMPTQSEKVVWAPGDGTGLTVYETPLGRLGGLICAEHNMSLARYALAQQGEEVHAAVWVSGSARRAEFNRWVELWSGSYALANQCYVISAQAVASDEEMERFGLQRRGGWSAILAPDASIVAGPITEQEGEVIGPIDSRKVVRTYNLFDAIDYHGRPDLFEFRLHRPEGQNPR